MHQIQLRVPHLNQQVDAEFFQDFRDEVLIFERAFEAVAYQQMPAYTKDIYNFSNRDIRHCQNQILV